MSTAAPAPGILAVVAAVAVLATACDGSTSSAAGSGAPANLGQELAYSECMRAHGEPNFPDPSASGGFQYASTPNGAGGTVNSTQLAAAQNACQHLLPGGTLSLAPPTRQQLSLDLRLAQCMRTHGAPDFPDPAAPGGGSASPVLSKAEFRAETQSPQFQAALRTCRSLLHIPPKPTP
jgi:hypothetical protein